MFDRARKATIEAIERFASYLERIALKLKRAASPSVVVHNATEETPPPDDDLGMG